MSRGPAIGRWISDQLIHGEGDFYGQPFQLRAWQQEILDDLYRTDEFGDRIVNRALLGLPKGNGKTELMAAIGMAELIGPYAPDSPNVVVAAASFEQADLVFGAMKIMSREGPLAPFLDVFDHRILVKNRPGRAFRVAAQAGTNDGLRPTCFIADELHEWVERKERVHLVIANSLAKRKNTLELNISTTGYDQESLLYRLYQTGRKIESGELEDPKFMFRWWEAPDTVDWDNITEVEAALLECNPAADDFWPVSNLMRRFREIPLFEFQRYHANKWTTAAVQWIGQTEWAHCTGSTTPPEDHTEIIVGFDGSYNGDSTALVGCTIPQTETELPHVFVIGAWENPGDDTWLVPRHEVSARLAETMRRYNVIEVVCDPYGWEREIDEWTDTYGTPPILAYPTNVRVRMIPAYNRFYTAVQNQTVTHDANPQLARHLANCVIKEYPEGVMITKERRSSPRRIDLAVAAVIAYERAARVDETTEVSVMLV